MRSLAVTLLLLFVPAVAFCEPVTTIRNNGNSANRVDLVILGDGYTASELSKYATDVESFVQALFMQDPFLEYQRYFNVYRVDVTSSESGADHPDRTPPLFRNTALDASYNCGNIQRLICVNELKVNDVLSRSLPLGLREVVLVLVNDTEYGGSGGAVAVASIDPQVVEIILHELGHSFGLLADEYTDPPGCDTTIEPAEPNVTRQTSRNLIKWNVGGGPPIGWIELTTQIPTMTMAPGVPGLYEGARYCVVGLYRPTLNSKMRSLGVPFEQVNSEQLVKRVYNRVSPIDSSQPSDSTISLTVGQTQTFSVDIPQPLTHSLDVTWKLDGNTVSTTQQFVFTASTSGSHVIDVVVADLTPLVRNDSAQVLRESQTWNVAVGSGVQLAASPTSVSPGDTLNAMWAPIASPTALDWIGVYQPGSSNTAYIDWFYVSCSKTAVSPRASGSCPVVIASNFAPGTYQLRLLANNGFSVLATSNNFTVDVGGQTTLAASPTSVSPGSTVNAMWAQIASPTALDWIGVYQPGASNMAYVDWFYVSCSKTAVSPRASGSCPVVIASNFAPGTYQLRLLANNGFSVLATSNNFTVDVAGQTTLTASPTSVSAGQTLSATWAQIVSPTSLDWIGIYQPGSSNTAYVDWFYVSCSKTPGSPRASGSCSFVIPASLAPGTYELRLLANNGFSVVATSNSFTADQTTLAASPTSVSPGDTLDATWAQIFSPTALDWIGVYQPGSANMAYVDWFYVSCSKTPGSPRVFGSCSFVMPGNLAPGTYELRLLANNGFSILATSNNFSITNAAGVRKE